jgi:hypothetical protein
MQSGFAQKVETSRVIQICRPLNVSKTVRLMGLNTELSGQTSPTIKGHRPRKPSLRTEFEAFVRFGAVLFDSFPVIEKESQSVARFATSQLRREFVVFRGLSVVGKTAFRKLKAESGAEVFICDVDIRHSKNF